MEKAPLRFKVGDRVLAKCGGGEWKEALITKLWSREVRGLVPYRMRTIEGDDIYTDIDSKISVRAYTEPGLPRVIQEMQCGSSWEDVEGLIDSYSIDIDVVGSSLLLHAATAGNDDVVTKLIDAYGVSEATSDKDGRNILHIALLHKHFHLVDVIREEYEDLFSSADNKGLNVIHYFIMSKNAKLLENLLYDKEFFERITSFSLANLVDPHYQRYDNAKLERVTNVITPLEWAKRMKQPEMVKILEKYINELRIHYKLSLISSTAAEKENNEESTHNSEDQHILGELLVVDGLISEWGLQKSELIQLNEIEVQLACLYNNCCRQAFVQSLTYLVEAYFISLRDHHPDLYAARIDLMLECAIYGPEYQAFPSNIDRGRMESYPDRWSRELSYVYMNWSPDSSTFLEFTQAALLKRKARTRSGDSWDKMMIDFMEKMIIAANGGVLVTQRCQVLQHLLSQKLANGSQVTLPLHSFVVQGQLHLLQRVASAGIVNLKCPVSACPSLVEHVHALSWLTLETKRKNKARSIPGDLTVAEVLCALAAGYGEFFIFQWLLEEVISPARHGVTFNNRDLLYIATSQNSLAIVKYLLWKRPITELQIVKAIVIAVPIDEHQIAKVLLDHFKEGKPSPEQHQALMAAAEQFKCGPLSLWASLERMRAQCLDLQQQVEADVPTKDLAQYFDKHVNLGVGLGWSLSSLGNVYGDIDTTVFCTQIELATDIESLLVCLLTIAIRANKPDFFDHIVNSLLVAIKHGMASGDMYSTSETSFVCLYSQLPEYAKRVGNTEIIAHLTRTCESLLAQLTAAPTEGPVKLDKSPFYEMYRHFEKGATVEVLEECLTRQNALGLDEEDLQSEMISLPYLKHSKFGLCAQLASWGQLHIICWVLETKKVKISLTNAERALDGAVLGGRLEIVQYLLTKVYDSKEPSPYLIKMGPSDLECEVDVDGEDEPQMLVFANMRERVIRKMCELFKLTLQGYSYQEENMVNKTDPHVAVLNVLLTHTVDKGYLHEMTLPTFTKAFHELQARDHPEMWVFVRRLCAFDTFQRLLLDGELLIPDIVQQLFRRLSSPRVAKYVEFRQRFAAHSAKLVSFLLDVGVRPDMESIVHQCRNIERDEFVLYWEQIVQLFYSHGLNIQRIVYVLIRVDDKDIFVAACNRLESIKEEQRKQWLIFDAISAGKSIEYLSSLTASGELSKLKDRSGKNLLEVAALHDRGDVILWLHREHQMDIRAVNREGLSVVMLCRRAGSLGASKVVADAIGGDTVRAFCWRHFHRRRALRAASAAQQLRVASAVKVQSCVRGRLVRNKYAPLLCEVKGSWNAFLGKWGAVLTALKEINTHRPKPFSWAEQKFKYDMAVDVSEQDIEVQSFLDQAAASSTNELILEPSGLEFSKITITGSTAATGMSASAEDLTDPVDAVELSQAVVRWLDKADETYRAMFHKKVARLAQGSRSYALSKRLKGCEYYICESKLDAGQRILWTYISRDDKQHVLVWFVSKHDNVCRCARLIDNACARTFRSLNRTTSDDATVTNSNNNNPLLTLTEDSVLLDPSRNVPMKIYIAQRSELPLLAEKAWKAPLRLNQREQGVRSQTGTVLLLGRSGTGKTLCVMDRMNHDRAASLLLQREASAPFKQLFVTRSSALCDFVRLYQQHNCAADDLAHTEYVTFDSFLGQLESSSTDSKTDNLDKNGNKKVDFLRFRDHVFPLLAIKAAHKLDALVVWTQIRSFLKGSIEAALEGGVLSMATYLDTSRFSRDRCRLLPEQRQEVYALFVQYQALHKLHGWWDDMDRAMQVLRPNLSVLMQTQQLQENGEETRDSTKVKYDKIYVDEVQDNTQVEIALYLVAVGGRVDALFLAGDPAQSVVEGVEFRFEEVRSLVYLLTQQQEALQRPTKLLVNYRSHSGILNCAGAVLGRMLAMFPGAAKTLPADEGLFLGPRPAFLSSNNTDSNGELSDVRKLLAGNERLVVLCPDERAAEVSAQLSASTASASNLVLGIRAAKGLEFTDIVLLDFFSSIPDSDYKAWKELLAVGDEASHNHGHGHGGELQQYAFPQLEPQLKLLYTGITRCINRLIFVESRRSRIGGLFFRWLKQHGLADAFTLTTSEVNGEGHLQQQQLMTRDEWRMRGIDIALSAEGAGDLARSERLLGQAAQSFQRAEEPALKAVAVAQAALYQAELQYCSISMVVSTEKVAERAHGEKDLLLAEEMAVASAVLRGLRAGLQQASQRLCHLLAERLDPQSKKFYTVELLRMCPKIM